MTYVGNSRKIRDALITILQGIQYNSEDAFTSVSGDTAQEFNGNRNVMVLPNKQSSQATDSRTFEHTASFAIIMQLPITSPDSVELDEYNAMLDLTDLVYDTLEHSDAIDKLTTIDPTIPDFIMNVPEAMWTVAGNKNGAALLMTLNVDIGYSKAAR